MTLEDRRFYLENCDRCSHCKWTPGVTSEKYSTSCPSVDHGKFHTYSANGKIAIAYGLMEGRLGYTRDLVESVYSCSMCGACDTGCKWNHSGIVEPLDSLYALRQRIVEDGQAPASVRNVIDSLRLEGNPYGMPRSDRNAWMRGDRALNEVRVDADTFLHIGCESAFNPAAWPELSSIVGLLRTAGIRFRISPEEGPTGDLAFDLGYQELARSQAEALASLIRTTGARRLITCSASAYAAFRNLWPRLGVGLDGVKVVHVSQAIEDAMAAGAIRNTFSATGKVTYHDPCKLGRLSEPFQPWSGKWTMAFNQVIVAEPPRKVRFGSDGQYQAPRSLLRRIPGVELVEMARSERFAYCCGAGAASSKVAPAMAEQAAIHRLGEAVDTGAGVLISSCATCTDHLRNVASRHSIPIEVKGLIEFLTGAMASHEQSEERPHEDF